MFTSVRLCGPKLPRSTGGDYLTGLQPHGPSEARHATSEFTAPCISDHRRSLRAPLRRICNGGPLRMLLTDRGEIGRQAPAVVSSCMLGNVSPNGSQHEDRREMAIRAMGVM